jgi:hypothetical protein
MKTIITKIKGDWQDVVDGCRITVAKPPLGKEPSPEFKRSILIAEHEPIREVWIKWKWLSIPYCIAMHWKTHIWPSRVNTSREDRTGVKRSERRQTDPVDFEGAMNLQHQIDTMRKRLCGQADPQTREYAEDYKEATRKIEPEASDVMVPNCVYRCGCPETKMCDIRMLSSFLAWCRAKKNVDVHMLPIQRRYDLYNEWFYEWRKNRNEISCE